MFFIAYCTAASKVILQHFLTEEDYEALHVDDLTTEQVYALHKKHFKNGITAHQVQIQILHSR